MEAPRGVEPTGTNGRTRHTFQPFPLWWVGSRPVVVSFVGWQGALFSCGHDDDTGEAFGCSRPLSGSRTATIGIVAWFRFCRPILVVGRCIGFAVVMAQVRRPVPFRTRKLRPGRGDGTALERVWESSTPPHSFVGPSGRVPYGIPGRSFSYSPRGSRRAFRSGNPIFVSERVFSSAHWRFLDAGRPVGGRIAPVSGWIWMLVNLPTYQFLQ